MKRFTLVLASLFLVMGAMAQVKLSTTLPSAGVPENLYYIKNANGKFAMKTTGITSYASSAGIFAFYASDTENAYYIYSVDEAKWVTYELKSGYNNGQNFVTLSATKGDDDKFYFNAYNGGEYYDVSPYNTTGVAQKYLNWYAGGGDTFGLYDTNANGDAGSKLLFTEVEILPEMSTKDAPAYYYIKNVRHLEKFVDWSFTNRTQLNQVQSGSFGSYWYFVKDEEAENVPAGAVACRIYNAASDAMFENAETGYFDVDGNWPQTWVLRPHLKDGKLGFAIHRLGDENHAWNDAGGNGEKIDKYGYNDAGSIFRASAVSSSNATTMLNNAKNLFNNTIDYASYYTIGDEAVDETKAVIASLNTSDIKNTIAGIVALGRKFRGFTYSDNAPAAGDVVQFRNKAQGTYLKDNGGSIAFVNNYYDYATFWVLEQGENGIKVKNYSTGKYLGNVVQSTATNLVSADEAKEFVFSEVDDYCYAVFKIHDGGDATYAHFSNGNLVGWYSGADASRWAIRKADFPAHGKHYIVKSALAAFSAVKAVYATDDHAKWGTLSKANKAYYWTAENVVVNGVVTGVALKNASTGEYMQDTQNAGNDNVWTMGDDDEARALKFENLTFYNEKTNEFSITNRHDMHARGHGGGSGNGDNVISYDAGTSVNSASSWSFIEVADIDAAIAAAAAYGEKQEALVTLLNSVKANYYDDWASGEKWRIGEGVNRYSQPEGDTPLKDAYDTAMGYTTSEDPTELDEQIAIINGLVANLVINQPTADRYYRVRCVDGQKYLSSIVNDNDILTTVDGANGADRVFYYTNGALMSYAKGVYVGANNSSAAIKFRNIGESAVVEFLDGKPNSQGGSYLIRVSESVDNNGRYIYGKKAFVDSGSSKPAGSDKGYNWWLEEVNALPVTITAAGWATLYAPVALTIADGVKAYAIKVEGNAAVLNEIEGVIPANTGVVLEGEANTYNFAITTTDATVASDLSGSAAATYYIEAGTYYALGLVEGEVGFYRDLFENSRFQNNSHKAYLYVPGSNNVASYSFRYEGTTGVEEVEVENTVKAIYDLTGRKVNEITAPGIYIVNGKKVLVK